MSLWVLIRKDEERMSYAENYFFFNSISKRKIHDFLLNPVKEPKSGIYNYFIHL